MLFLLKGKDFVIYAIRFFFVSYSSRVYRTAHSDISDFAGMKDRVEIVCQLKYWYRETHKLSARRKCSLCKSNNDLHLLTTEL